MEAFTLIFVVVINVVVWWVVYLLITKITRLFARVEKLERDVKEMKGTN